RFNQIHSKDGSRLKQQLISAKSGEVVPREEIVKGYEFARGQYVVFEPDELKALEAQSTHTIDVSEFVPAGAIDRQYLDKTYYLGPDRGGARAYRLLARAMADTGTVAVAQYAARGKQYLVLVRPKADGLVMEQLHYAAELRSFDEIPIEEAEIRDDELQLARQLIAQATSDSFRPDSYRDEVRARVLELIQRKVDGEDITLAPSEDPEHKIIDLMEALKASLETGAARQPPRRAAKATKAAARKRAAR
ncbi:MAG: Ku protein, partial [Rhodospirillaceae bacterium]|nr:Ku protein [Rhodospirillaceae bacterium]